MSKFEEAIDIEINKAEYISKFAPKTNTESMYAEGLRKALKIWEECQETTTEADNFWDIQAANKENAEESMLAISRVRHLVLNAEFGGGLHGMSVGERQSTLAILDDLLSSL